MWYAIQVYTGKEQETIDLCRKCIEGVDYRIENPKLERSRKYLGSWHKECSIMFPGYVFVVTDDIDAFRMASKKVPRITKVLGAEDQAIPLTEEEVETLHKLVNDEYVVELSKGIKVGDSIAVTDGPLKGMEALIIKVDRHKRTAAIRVPMMGREIETVVGLEVLVDEPKKN